MPRAVRDNGGTFCLHRARHAARRRCGFTSFNRYFFAQTNREGAVIDERFNGGGAAADYIIDHLRRPLMNYWTPRYGADVTTPGMAIFGPKAMLINEYAGSGGDLIRTARRGPSEDVRRPGEGRGKRWARRCGPPPRARRGRGKERF